MKSIISIVITTLFIMLFSSVIAQGFQPPPEGKAMIYFVRSNAVGALNPFKFFHNDKYIGSVKKVNYMMYESNPGEQLFWCKSTGTSEAFFLTADLSPDKTYIVFVAVAASPKKIIGPVTISNSGSFKKAKKKILKKTPFVTPESEVVELNQELEEYITKKLDQYNTHLKNEIEYNHMSADMAIPKDAMK